MARWQNVNGIYQIYPRSFKDTDADGIGDLAGITEKLGYIKGEKDSLGIDAIWISPFFKSPMADFGYDVADYRRVDPIFGTNEDFEVLLKEAHRREIKVMIDYVPNHTSDQHEWFLESKEGRDSEKRHWYVWRDPRPDGSPPNNWLSVFGGSAWELDEKSGQYYLHSFLKEQPDLNWDNPDVRKAMTDVLDYWLSMGVDGIRADAVRWLSKDLVLLEDNPPNPAYQKGDDPYHQQLPLRSQNGDSLHQYLYEIAKTVAKYRDRIVLFEDYIDTRMNREAQYIGMYSVYPRVAAPFNFEGMNTPYDAEAFREFISNFENLLGSELRPFYCFSNHDKPRLASRVGQRQAMLIGMLQLTLPGIPVVYYGDELGMRDVKIHTKKVRDPFERNVPGLGLGRDPERTPMQWSPERYAGFSVARPWLPVAKESDHCNVASELADPYSSLTLYRTLLQLRRSKALYQGKYIEWPQSTKDVFGFIRQKGEEEILVLLNMSDKVVDCLDGEGGVVYSTHPSVEWTEKGITLQPHQGVVIRRHSD